MARKRTAPAHAAPTAPAPPSNGRLTDQALRAQVRRSRPPVFNILKPFYAIKDEVADKL